MLLDSKSAVELTYDPVAFKKTKHILRAANELRDRVAREIFEPQYAEGANQLAGMRTKAPGPTAHRTHMPHLLAEDAASSGLG